MEGTSEVVNNTKQQQFEILLDSEVAYLTYRFYKNDIALMHTVVPEKHRGKGLGNLLVKYAFSYAKNMQKKVMVYCPYVGKFVKENPEYKVYLDSEYHK